jgi:hypothetical protein
VINEKKKSQVSGHVTMTTQYEFGATLEALEARGTDDDTDGDTPRGLISERVVTSEVDTNIEVHHHDAQE